ncbi:MAG: hypothetical protein ABIF01_01245 [Candidatus Micrarchaeota archaeon]
MAYGQGSGADLMIDVLVLAAVIALIPSKSDLFSVLLLSFLAIAIVAMESKVRGFKLTGYVDDGMKAFRPMYWATALLLIVLYYKPIPGVTIWDPGGNGLASFILSTMLVFLAMLLVAYRAAAHND